jgi:hypothetical protein
VGLVATAWRAATPGQRRLWTAQFRATQRLVDGLSPGDPLAPSAEGLDEYQPADAGGADLAERWATEYDRRAAALRLPSVQALWWPNAPWSPAPGVTLTWAAVARTVEARRPQALAGIQAWATNADWWDREARQNPTTREAAYWENVQGSQLAAWSSWALALPQPVAPPTPPATPPATPAGGSDGGWGLGLLLLVIAWGSKRRRGRHGR